jgi:hypothetical protein
MTDQAPCPFQCSLDVELVGFGLGETVHNVNAAPVSPTDTTKVTTTRPTVIATTKDSNRTQPLRSNGEPHRRAHIARSEAVARILIIAPGFGLRCDDGSWLTTSLLVIAISCC